jgi:tRNA A58 N-methylase Trm61
MPNNIIESILKPVYDKTLRQHLPKKISSYNGIPVKDKYLYDITERNPYKPKAMEIIRSEVNKGDEVVDIAAGYGIFSVVAAKNGASVRSYDADPKKVELARKTAELSFVEDEIDVKQAIVGEIVTPDVNPSMEYESIPRIGSIPECDLLILDVEGAETKILQNLQHSPRTILVEAHPDHGASVEQVTNILEEQGYTTNSVVDMETHSNYFINSQISG